MMVRRHGEPTVWIATDATRCAKLRAAAWSYLDDECSSAERRWMHVHEARCHHCRMYLEFQRAFLRTLRVALSRVGVDGALHERVHAALSESRSPESAGEALDAQEPSD